MPMPLSLSSMYGLPRRGGNTGFTGIGGFPDGGYGDFGGFPRPGAGRFPMGAMDSGSGMDAPYDTRSDFMSQFRGGTQNGATNYDPWGASRDMAGAGGTPTSFDPWAASREMSGYGGVRKPMQMSGSPQAESGFPQGFDMQAAMGRFGGNPAGVGGMGAGMGGAVDPREKQRRRGGVMGMYA